MVGTGALAPYLIAAHGAVRPIRETRIWGRDPAKAAALAARLAAAGTAAVAAPDLAEAAAAADIITCATLSPEPLVRGAWLKPGAHLDLVGSYRPDMRETDDDAIRRARVFVDTEAALHEAGDIVQPLRSGVLARDGIAGDLFGLCSRDLPAGGRRRRDHAVQIGRHRARRPRRRQTGIRPLRGPMNIVANFAKFMGYRGYLDEALRLRDAAVRGLRYNPYGNFCCRLAANSAS